MATQINCLNDRSCFNFIETKCKGLSSCKLYTDELNMHEIMVTVCVNLMIENILLNMNLSFSSKIKCNILNHALCKAFTLIIISRTKT